jgi:membrane protease YdiL (CAAX protease family)
LSYLRLRHGLASAMAAHFIWNAFAVGMAALGG